MLAERLPAMVEQVKKAAKRLKVMKYVVNYDDLYDFALDQLIHQVKRVGDGELLEEKLSYHLSHLNRTAITTLSNRLNRRKEFTLTDGERSIFAPAADDQSVESLLNEIGGLTETEKDILLTAVYHLNEKGQGERVIIKFPTKASKTKWLRLRPALREWATANGLEESGE